MAGAEHQLAAGKGVGSLRAVHSDGSQPAVLNGNIRQMGAETDVRSEINQLLTEGLKCDIKVIGEETILVCIDEKDCSCNSKKGTKKNFDFIFK
jgi:hypothetical protein